MALVHSPVPALGPSLTFSPLAQPPTAPSPFTIIITSSRGTSQPALSVVWLLPSPQLLQAPPSCLLWFPPNPPPPGGSRPGSQEGPGGARHRPQDPQAGQATLGVHRAGRDSPLAQPRTLALTYFVILSWDASGGFVDTAVGTECLAY